ncbi:MAG: nucleoside monophosphate kinase [Candidatus Eremiobacteraeota bacterium]|nr:nucleoside monophosphate kinase [Candidatus Eremiobacteraeota bacterium]
MCTGNPWGAVAPRAHVGDSEYKLVPDSVQLNSAPTPAQPAQARPSGYPNMESLSKQTGIAIAAAANPSPLMVVLLGTHDSSKKDQAETIAHNLGLVHLNMGDMIKQEVSSGSELGVNLQKALDGGDQSPALLLYDLVAKRVEQPDVQERGMVLDAYPEDFKHHKAEALLEELEGLRLIELSTPEQKCADCTPVVQAARQRGAYFQVDDEKDRQDTADVLEALVDNFHSAPVRMLAV